MEEMIMNGAEQVVESAASEATKRGIFSADNGIKVLAVTGAAAVCVVGFKAFKKAYANVKARRAVKVIEPEVA